MDKISIAATSAWAHERHDALATVVLLLEKNGTDVSVACVVPPDFGHRNELATALEAIAQRIRQGGKPPAAEPAPDKTPGYH